jgi:D-glycero-alpha-D-manno-heptose-7-phosphate kinase
MLISRTPYRISFFGGGTDYPVWYKENKGAVLAVTIDKYCYITSRYLPQFFEHKSRIVYSQTELINDIDEIHHPSVRESLRFLGIDKGIELHYDGDLPARSGLGSSSAFTIGLLNALHGLKGNRVSKYQLAKEAIHIEQNMIKENVGSQDQIMASFGGLNHIIFKDGEFVVTPVTISKESSENLENHLMLFYTGISRIASNIAKEQIKETPNKKNELTQMLLLVDEGIKLLNDNGNLEDFGKLMHENWMIKKSLTKKISSLYIDWIYEAAIKAGATGGKILGAGGGGFILFFVKPQFQEAVSKSLQGLLQVPFKFENSGSQIIYYE